MLRRLGFDALRGVERIQIKARARVLGPRPWAECRALGSTSRATL